MTLLRCASSFAVAIEDRTKGRNIVWRNRDLIDHRQSDKDKEKDNFINPQAGGVGKTKEKKPPNPNGGFGG
jgi:hypothetical protein